MPSFHAREVLCDQSAAREDGDLTVLIEGSEKSASDSLVPVQFRVAELAEAATHLNLKFPPHRELQAREQHVIQLMQLAITAVCTVKHVSKASSTYVRPKIACEAEPSGSDTEINRSPCMR